MNDTNGQTGILPELTNAGPLLTLKEIGERLGVSYDRLRGFATARGIEQQAGAVNVRGVKGVRYPFSAVDLFARLIAAQDAGLVTPATAGAFLSSISQVEAASGQIAPLPNAAADALAAALVRAFGQMGILPSAGDDRLVGREEAARVLACSPRSVGRYVRPVRANVWRWSDLQNYIRQLGK